MVRWHSFTETASAAAEDAEIAAMLEASAAMIDSTLANDADAFVAGMAPECIVNNPMGHVVPGAAAAALMKQGLIYYETFERSIEYVGKHPGHIIVMMGVEIVVPKGANPLAGKTVRRRFTDIWRQADEAWKLSARQATNISID